MKSKNEVKLGTVQLDKNLLLRLKPFQRIETEYGLTVISKTLLVTKIINDWMEKKVGDIDE